MKIYLKLVIKCALAFFHFHVFSPVFGRFKIGSRQKHGLKFKNSSEPSRDLFWCQTPCFWPWGIIWDHLPEPQIDLKVKNRVVGL